MGGAFLTLLVPGVLMGGSPSITPPAPQSSTMQYEGGYGDMRRLREAERRRLMELEEHNEESLALLAVMELM